MDSSYVASPSREVSCHDLSVALSPRPCIRGHHWLFSHKSRYSLCVHQIVGSQSRSLYQHQGSRSRILSLCLMDTDSSLAATSAAFATGPWHELTLLNNNYASAHSSPSSSMDISILGPLGDPRHFYPTFEAELIGVMFQECQSTFLTCLNGPIA